MEGTIKELEEILLANENKETKTEKNLIKLGFEKITDNRYKKYLSSQATLFANVDKENIFLYSMMEVPIGNGFTIRGMIGKKSISNYFIEDGIRDMLKEVIEIIKEKKCLTKS